MTGGIPLGALGPATIRVSWVTFLSFWLIVIALATEYFPFRGADLDSHPWQAAFAASALLYAGFAANALIRIAVGRLIHLVPVEITVLLSGPMVRFRPSLPWREGLIAFVGPLASFVFAAIAYGVSVVLLNLGRSQLGASVLVWVAGMSLFLGVLNLLPASPLDGAAIVTAWARRRTPDADSMSSFVRSSTTALPFGLTLVGTALILAGAHLAGLLLAGLAIEFFRLEAQKATRGE